MSIFKFFNKSPKEEMKSSEEEIKNPEEEIMDKEESEKNFESKEEMEEEKNLVEKMEEAQEALESIGGKEGLEATIKEIGDEKTRFILNNDRMKRMSKKVMEAATYAAVSPAIASTVYFLTELYNKGYHGGAEINPALTGIITGVGVALIELEVIRSWMKEKKEKKARESSVEAAI